MSTYESGTDSYIERSLWYEKDGSRMWLRQRELQQRTEPIVILGEPGMGKTELLKQLSKLPGSAYCAARQLLNRNDPKTLQGKASVLLIDELDVVATAKEGDAVDLVLRTLGKLKYPRFILACRVADWRNATAKEAIYEQYQTKPTVLHIEPFGDDEARAYLERHLGVKRAQSVIDHFVSRGLNDLLGNPQTLKFVADVAREGSLPQTQGDLFARAVEILRLEHREDQSRRHPSAEAGCDAAGAAFAGLILTGTDVIVRKNRASLDDGEIALHELSTLPNGQEIESMLGTRLFKSDGAERFAYLHRRVAEYLGARWLAKQAEVSPRKKRRLLALFHQNGLVPTSLRGLHAWLVLDPALADEVIAADPMGMVEYGDVALLSTDQVRVLLRCIKELGRQNPYFYDERISSIPGLVRPELAGDLKQLIGSSETPFGLRVLLLQALGGATSVGDFIGEIQAIILDKFAGYSVRYAAVEAISRCVTQKDSRSLLLSLNEHENEESARIAINLVERISYDQVEDDDIVTLIVGFATCRRRLSGVLDRVARRFPDERLPRFLDLYCAAIRGMDEDKKRSGNEELTDFAYHLIARAVAHNDVESERLWAWLEPLDSSVGYDSVSRERLAAALGANDQMRRAIQCRVLLELPGNENIHLRQYELSRRSHGFLPTSEDVVHLLDALDATDKNDLRWQQVVTLVGHQENAGVDVRAAARRFVKGNRKLKRWLDQLPRRRLSTLERKFAKERRDRQAKSEKERKKIREGYVSRIDALRKGEINLLIDPAYAYLKLLAGIGDDAPPHERITHWLGEDVRDAAHEGFEAFVRIDPPVLSAQDIVSAMINGKIYHAEHILVAGFAERCRTGAGFDDLSSESLLAGFFALRRSRIEEYAGIDGIGEIIETTIQNRGLWELAMRRYYEPQFAVKTSFIEDLGWLTHDDNRSDLAVKLATEWLHRFPEMAARAEFELVNMLLRAGRHDELRRIIASRESDSDERRSREWEAVNLVVDFENAKSRLARAATDPDLLWNIRDLAWSRIGNARISLSAVQREWVVSTFRQLWPVVEHPVGVMTGNRNPWDASDFLLQLIRVLGTDSSTEAQAALSRLKEQPVDGYTATIKVTLAENSRMRADAAYRSPTLAAIKAIALDTAPKDGADLQVWVLEELKIAQAKIISDDAESWRGFYDEKRVPFEEERCRDHLLGLLRQGAKEITYAPETHIAEDKEVDITCSVGQLWMPIEIKGQWHDDLWDGADQQLDKYYTQDWRAEKRGIYLVLWFGADELPDNKKLKTPGRGKKRPGTPEELREMLVAGSRSAKEGRVAVVVLDLTRT